MNRDAYNAYHREYYKNVVDKDKRKEQFAEYYRANKVKIAARRRAQRAAKKLAVGIEPTTVEDTELTRDK